MSDWAKETKIFSLEGKTRKIYNKLDDDKVKTTKKWKLGFLSAKRKEPKLLLS